MADFNPYHKWLGIPLGEQPANHYRLLGIEDFESDADVIETAAERQTLLLRTFQTGPNSELAERLLNEVSAARVCLLDGKSKARYDTQLRAAQQPVPEDDPLAFTTEELAAVPSKSATRSRQRSRGGKPVWKEPWAIPAAAGGIVVLLLLIMILFGSGESPKGSGQEQELQAEIASLKEKLVAAGNKKVVPTAREVAVKSGPAINEPLPAKGAVAPPLAVAPFDATKAQEYQQAWANHLGVPVVTTNSIGMKLALIPPGEFMMGSNEFKESEKPVHKVTLTRPFQLGMYEVTQEQYTKVVGINPSKYKGSSNPVEQVNWVEAVAFCKLLSDLPEEKASGHMYRLPTEAEWEYACRAGTTTEYAYGDDPSLLGEFAWYTRNSGKQTHPVGKKLSNSWGLNDMHGNVWEWCSDLFVGYPNASAIDPKTHLSNSDRVVRGGGWSYSEESCRSAGRSPCIASYRGLHGFRVVCVFSGQQEGAASVNATDTVESDQKPPIPESVVAPIQGEYGFTHSNNTYIELRFNRDGTVNELMWTTVSKKQSSKRTSTGGRYIHVSWSRENGSWVYTLYWPNPGKLWHIQRIVFEDSGKIRGFHYGKNGELAITGTKIK